VKAAAQTPGVQELPSALRTIPGAHVAQDELVAVVQLTGEAQFGTGVHAAQALGIPPAR